MSNATDESNSSPLDIIAEVPEMTHIEAPAILAPPASPEPAPVDATAATVPDLIAATIPASIAPMPTEVVVKPKIVELTQEEMDKKDAIVKQIDFSDPTLPLQYGVGLEKALAPITENILSSTRTRDLGGVGSLITDVMVQVKNIDLDGEEKGFFAKLFSGAKTKIEVLKAGYADVEKNINKLDRELEGYQITMHQDFILMEKMYEQNRAFARSLTLYILAGKEAVEKYRQGELAELAARANSTKDAEDAQELRRAEALLNSFEKRIDALMAIKTSSVQMAPQIQLMQNNNMSLAESLNNTRSLVLPMWKSQYSLAIMIEHERQAVDVQKKVTDTTNELLRKNAEMLRQASVDIAKEGERPIIDLETLRHVNAQIIGSLEDIMRIQEEGRKMRAESEKAYSQIESELVAQAIKYSAQTSLLSGAQEVQ
jgi:uncharacterized protein YaaN involved in tellurite resistance